MAISRALSAAIVLSLMSGHQTLVAGEFTVEIAGVAGTAFGGTCLLIVASNNASHDVSGTVPRTLEFSADLISCAIQKKAGAGGLHMVIKRASGEVVAQSSDAQPFGVVMAGGR